MNHRNFRAGIAALLIAGVLPVSACAAPTADSPSTEEMPISNAAAHIQYLGGYNDGTFRPEASIKRAELATILSRLLEVSGIQVDVAFTDMTGTHWAYDAVRTALAEGWVSGYPDATFRPDAPITRAELVTILSRAVTHTDLGVTASFTDVPDTHWAKDAIETALAQDWVSGYPDGTFRPDRTVTRAEAVTMVNRVLGRTGDAAMAATGEGMRIMPDVPDTHWAYLAMLEATVDHTYATGDGYETWTGYDREQSGLAAGWHIIGGQTFHVDANGLFDRNTMLDGLELDRNGRYTSGNEALDALLTAAASKAVTANMTHEQMLRAMYDYAKANLGYLGIAPADTTVPGWDIQYATDMLQTGSGNCYSWASAFTHLARKAGYPAKVVVGMGVSPAGNESPHAWTEIAIDGVAYTFDPQIESVYAKRYQQNYDLFMKAYGAAEWGYKADAAQAPEEDTPEADAALSALMAKVYGTADASEGMQQTVLHNGMGADGQSYTLSYFLGSNDIKIEAGLASEPMINVNPHSIVLARLADGQDAAAAKKLVEENADPFKWVCVGVEPENVLVDVVGDTLILIMDNTRAQEYLSNFRTAMAE